MPVCYTIKIHYRAKVGSDREAWVLEAAKAYECDPDTHLIDRLFEDRHRLFAAHKAEVARIAAEEAKLADEKRKVMGGK
jgi:hypothetical protein